jgi:hypothetical protein
MAYTLLLKITIRLVLAMRKRLLLPSSGYKQICRHWNLRKLPTVRWGLTFLDQLISFPCWNSVTDCTASHHNRRQFFRNSNTFKLEINFYQQLFFQYFGTPRRRMWEQRQNFWIYSTLSKRVLFLNIQNTCGAHPASYKIIKMCPFLQG